MTRFYPEGAIKSVKELRSLVSENVPLPIFIASWQFRSIDRLLFSGTVGVEIHLDGWKYRYLQVCFNSKNRLWHTRSTTDCNLGGGGYNDWFVFVDEAKAKAWAAQAEEVA